MNWRVIAAFLIAPWTVPAVFALFSLRWGSVVGEKAHVSWWSGLGYGLLFYGSFALPFAYLAELVLGVPAWLVFRRRNVRSWAAFAGAGALMGLLVFLGIAMFSWDKKSENPAAVFDLTNPYLALCALSGAIASVVFRTIVNSGRR